jgi:adenosine kinase
VGVQITTLGADGVRITTRDGTDLPVPAVPTTAAVDPTGVGDAFRAGFLAGLAWHWPHRQAALLCCALATIVLESAGSQEYRLRTADLLQRVARTYGATAARRMAPRLHTATGSG